MIRDLYITDEAELAKVGSMLSHFLVIDIAMNPKLVVRAYEVLERTLAQIEQETRALSDDPTHLGAYAVAVKDRILKPMEQLRKATEAISTGEDYNVAGLAACIGMVEQAEIGLLSRVRALKEGCPPSDN